VASSSGASGAGAKPAVALIGRCRAPISAMTSSGLSMPSWIQSVACSRPSTPLAAGDGRRAVGGDRQAKEVGLVDDRPQLAGRELALRLPRTRGEQSTARHDLDHVDAALGMGVHGAAHGVGALFGRAAQVMTMPARRGEWGAGAHNGGEPRHAPNAAIRARLGRRRQDRHDSGHVIGQSLPPIDQQGSVPFRPPFLMLGQGGWGHR
jgi:hypothetical protein